MIVLRKRPSTGITAIVSEGFDDCVAWRVPPFRHACALDLVEKGIKVMSIDSADSINNIAGLFP